MSAQVPATPASPGAPMAAGWGGGGPDEDRSYRRERRRLLRISAPVTGLLVLIALRLLTLNAVHAETRAGYDAGDRVQTLTWAERQGWLNVVERFRAAFAVGDAYVLSGHFALARPWFEEAMLLVPKGGLDECKVRVNLGLTYEALGDEAAATGRSERARQFYDKARATTQARPPFCDAPEGEGTGQQLRDTEARVEAKTRPDAASEPQPGETSPPTTPQPTPTPTPSGGATQGPSAEQEEMLRDQQRQNTIERYRWRGRDEEVVPDGGIGRYPRPW